MRTFIAIPLPEQVHHQLQEIQDGLKKFNADIGWTRPEGIHLTLKFLGEITETQRIEIKSALELICEEQSPFELEITGTGVFPTATRPRVLWIGITKGSQETIALADKVESVIEPIGFPRETRKFNPHLTLGRVRTPNNLPELTKYFLQSLKPNLGIIPVNQIILYQSKLSPKGAHYTPLDIVIFRS